MEGIKAGKLRGLVVGEKFQTLEIKFRRIDHMPEPMDICDFMDHGGTAPNNRFRCVFDE